MDCGLFILNEVPHIIAYRATEKKRCTTGKDAAKTHFLVIAIKDYALQIHPNHAAMARNRAIFLASDIVQ